MTHERLEPVPHPPGHAIRVCAAILVAVVTLVALAVLALNVHDVYRSRFFASGVQWVQVGDSKEQVLAKLGRATEAFLPAQYDPLGLGVRVETWAYGKRFDWQHCFHREFPYFWPLTIRLFRPDANDVTIEFDSADRANRISTPRL